MEKELIFNTLNAVNDNRTHAAKMLGISIRTLRNKLNDYREGDGKRRMTGTGFIVCIQLFPERDCIAPIPSTLISGLMKERQLGCSTMVHNLLRLKTRTMKRGLSWTISNQFIRRHDLHLVTVIGFAGAQP
jgi:hypothetical protein